MYTSGCKYATPPVNTTRETHNVFHIFHRRPNAQRGYTARSNSFITFEHTNLFRRENRGSIILTALTNPGAHLVASKRSKHRVFQAVFTGTRLYELLCAF